MRITKILLLLLPLFSTAFATNLYDIKKDRVPGYIITLDGDKIEGEVVPGSVTDNETKVVFYADGKDKKKVYKPIELKGYGFQDQDEDDFGFGEGRWIHFETHKVDYPPKPFGPTTVFMHREEEGALTLFCYYTEVRSDVKNPYKYTYYIKGSNDQVKKVDKEGYRNIARSLFKEYNALSSRIGQKDFQYRNLDRMIRDYNYWSVNQHDSNEYRVALKE